MSRGKGAQCSGRDVVVDHSLGAKRSRSLNWMQTATQPAYFRENLSIVKTFGKVEYKASSSILYQLQRSSGCHLDQHLGLLDLDVKEELSRTAAMFVDNIILIDRVKATVVLLMVMD